MQNFTAKQRSLIALSLIAPVTSIGALMTTWIAPGSIGQTIALLGGIWMVIFPSLWRRWDASIGPIVTFKSPPRSTWIAGIILGLLMFGMIAAGYWWVGRQWIDVADARSRVKQLGMNVPLMVYGFGTFQTLLNSFIEEYVWRGFVDRHCQVVWSPRWSIVLSAAFFTVHHVILMVAYSDNVGLIFVGTVAVFAAGVVWSVARRAYRSLLPCYLSHLAADLVLQIASWHILLS
jgi:uncharacterized protein